MSSLELMITADERLPQTASTGTGVVAVAVQNVVKSYASVTALQGVSFEVRPGEVFGLLGPNGAGKTTLIRIILDMIRPDSGRVTLFGQPFTPSDRTRVGYLPEERGLYLSRKVLPVVEYFGVLKGMKAADARRCALEWLERLGMADVKGKRISELSKGNQQKVQLAATLVNHPEVAVLDEPFSGLDPVSVRLVSSVIRDLKQAGKTVLLSSHQMSLVESLCDRIFMVNRGKAMLYGTVDEVRRDHSENAVLIRCDADLSKVPGVVRHVSDERGARVYLREGFKAGDFLRAVLAAGADVTYFEPAITSLEDIFVKVVEDGRQETPRNR
jgi:ABC-2 type transport system ATP-binding protein